METYRITQLLHYELTKEDVDNLIKGKNVNTSMESNDKMIQIMITLRHKPKKEGK